MPTQAKHRLYLDRLYLIHQRMRRNKMFQQNNQLLAGSANGPTAQVPGRVVVQLHTAVFWGRAINQYSAL